MILHQLLGTAILVVAGAADSRGVRDEEPPAPVTSPRPTLFGHLAQLKDRLLIRHRDDAAPGRHDSLVRQPSTRQKTSRAASHNETRTSVAVPTGQETVGQRTFASDDARSATLILARSGNSDERSLGEAAGAISAMEPTIQPASFDAEPVITSPASPVEPREPAEQEHRADDAPSAAIDPVDRFLARVSELAAASSSRHSNAGATSSASEIASEPTTLREAREQAVRPELIPPGDGEVVEHETQPALSGASAAVQSERLPARTPVAVQATQETAAPSSPREAEPAVSHAAVLNSADAVMPAGFLGLHGRSNTQAPGSVDERPSGLRLANDGSTPAARFSEVRLPGWTKQMPVEYSFAGLLLVGSVLLMLASRGRRVVSREPLDPLAIASAASTGAYPRWVGFPAAGRGELQPVPQSGGMFGAFTTVIGLAIVAVGASAIARAYVANQAALFRPGVLIAAGGQFVLLLGIIWLAAPSGHRARARKSSEIELLQAELASLKYALAPAGAQPAWVAGGAARPSQAPNSGQIAQLKAQLACLSQQLDMVTQA